MKEERHFSSKGKRKLKRAGECQRESIQEGLAPGGQCSLPGGACTATPKERTKAQVKS